MNMHVGSTQDGAESIPAQLLAQEEARKEALLTVARLRKEASAEIERLLSFMDETDGYTMTECEPSLGAAEIPPSFQRWSEKYQFRYTEQGDQTRWAAGATDDRELPEGDDEPSLGSLERHCTTYGPWDGRSSAGSQELWSAGGTTDIEDEHDGAEPENEGGESVREDDEPSLGWTIDGMKGAYHDRELAHD